MSIGQLVTLGVCVLMLLAAPRTGRGAPAKPRPGRDAVWSPPDGALDKLHAELARGGAIEAALVSVMRLTGAAPAAVAFSRSLGDLAGYMGERTEVGPLIVGTLSFPLRASNISEPFVIDATGRLLRPAGDDHVDARELGQNAVYRSLPLAAKLEAYPPLEPHRVERGASGIALIYEHPLRECPPCPPAGTATVAHRFDPRGKYLGRTLISVTGPVIEGAKKTWRLAGGLVAYSTADGAGGYENEGQALFVQDSGPARKVLAEYFPITKVTAAPTRAGRTALVVELTDGMSDAPHVALVDPARGEVFIRKFARVAGIRGDRLELTVYRPKDWDTQLDDRTKPIKPSGRESVDLAAALKRKVIVNPPLR